MMCPYAECPYAEFPYSECPYTECPDAEYPYDKCCHAECPYAECCHSECCCDVMMNAILLSVEAPRICPIFEYLWVQILDEKQCGPVQ
jgi:hypothetical protein